VWSSDPRDVGAVLGAVKARPGMAVRGVRSARRPALTAPARDAFDDVQVGTKERSSGTNKGTERDEEQAMR
jgi:hypothetical protein